MSLRSAIMRLLAPSCEKHRMQFRHELARTQAHAEDLQRTVKTSPQSVAEAVLAHERARKAG